MSDKKESVQSRREAWKACVKESKGIKAAQEKWKEMKKKYDDAETPEQKKRREKQNGYRKKQLDKYRNLSEEDKFKVRLKRKQKRDAKKTAQQPKEELQSSN